MKKRFTEEQIIRMLKAHEGGRCAGKQVLASQPSIVGRASLAAWRSMKPSACGNWRQKTTNSKSW